VSASTCSDALSPWLLIRTSRAAKPGELGIVEPVAGARSAPADHHRRTCAIGGDLDGGGALGGADLRGRADRNVPRGERQLGAVDRAAQRQRAGGRGGHLGACIRFLDTEIARARERDIAACRHRGADGEGSLAR
jgi:hypothetical protein